MALEAKKIKIGRKYIFAISFKLLSKNLIVLRGAKGFVMCGYLDLAVAQKLGDCAVRMTGVSTIKQALEAKVESATSFAKKLGIYPGQPVKQALRLLV